MKVLLFGATGLAGRGVLRACLESPAVTEVRAIVRRSTGASDAKLREIIHGNYLDYEVIAGAFAGVDACFFCLGLSVRQAPAENDYRRIHQEFPIAAATILRAESPAAPFQYLSGKSTDLKSRWMWARVKAEAERELMASFDAVCWRPGMIDSRDSTLYGAAEVFRPVLRAAFKPLRGMYVESVDIGRGMLEATTQDLRRRILENAEIRDLADQWRERGGYGLS